MRSILAFASMIVTGTSVAQSSKVPGEIPLTPAAAQAMKKAITASGFKCPNVGGIFRKDTFDRVYCAESGTAWKPPEPMFQYRVGRRLDGTLVVVPEP